MRASFFLTLINHNNNADSTFSSFSLRILFMFGFLLSVAEFSISTRFLIIYTITVGKFVAL